MLWVRMNYYNEKRVQCLLFYVDAIQNNALHGCIDLPDTRLDNLSDLEVAWYIF